MKAWTLSRNVLHNFKEDGIKALPSSRGHLRGKHRVKCTGAIDLRTAFGCDSIHKPLQSQRIDIIDVQMLLSPGILLKNTVCLTEEETNAGGT
jgi:hypothetical protein